MKYKTNELTGALLDAAVAKAEGRVDFIRQSPDGLMVLLPRNGRASLADPYDWDAFCPSTHWADGGPIIDRERIQVAPQLSGAGWVAAIGFAHTARALDPLTAAMRAYVASKFGEEVDLP